MMQDWLDNLLHRGENGQGTVELALLMSWIAIAFIPGLVLLTNIVGRLYSLMLISLNS